MKAQAPKIGETDFPILIERAPSILQNKNQNHRFSGSLLKCLTDTSAIQTDLIDIKDRHIRQTHTDS